MTCQDGSVPAGLTTQALAPGAFFGEFDETGQGPVRKLTLVRDQAYALLVSIFIPAGAEGPARRREEKLPVTQLPPARRAATSRSSRRSLTARKPHAEPITRDADAVPYWGQRRVAYFWF